MRKSISVLLIIFIITLSLLSACSRYEEPFRLHIIANSDSEYDQEIKLKVRDAILRLTEEDMSEFKNVKEAEKYAAENLSRLIECANNVLEENGAEYTARGEIGVFEFPDRTYGDVTYPAGDYYALRIVLGNGSGKNWWCVMFPPLCVINTEAEQSDNILYKSAILEWIKESFSILTHNNAL